MWNEVKSYHCYSPLDLEGNSICPSKYVSVQRQGKKFRVRVFDGITEKPHYAYKYDDRDEALAFAEKMVKGFPKVRVENFEDKFEGISTIIYDMREKVMNKIRDDIAYLGGEVSFLLPLSTEEGKETIVKAYVKEEDVMVVTEDGENDLVLYILDELIAIAREVECERVKKNCEVISTLES